MENDQLTDKSTSTGLHKRRPTIGCLTSMIGLGDDITQAFWLGVTDIAQKRDVNLICFPGGWLYDPRGFRAQANVLYELVNAANVEGVVSWGTSIGSHTGADELGAFHKRYRPLPVVIAGGVLEGFPGLLIDSYTSMRAAIVHLIEVHGYRRMAFIRGPDDSFHAQERYRAYVETLEAHGLPIDPSLITQPLPWGHSAGMEAMRLLLDKRELRPHTDFDAVVGASDELLLGALNILQARGVKVPGDVAAVGFDNSAEGKAHTPPFTSVASPHYEMGYQGVEMLLSLMEGGQVVEGKIVPELVIRQSCGCLNPAIVQAAVDLEEVRDETFESFFASRREQVFSVMAQAVGESSKNVASGWEERLLENFAGELKGGSPGLFLQELGEVLHQAMAAGCDVPAWQGLVSALRRQIVPYLDGEMSRRAENLWQQARVMIGETAQRAQAYHALQAAQQAQTLREIETALLTTFNVAGLMDILAQNLPRLGVPSCYLALYENPQPYRYPQSASEWSRLVLAYTEQGCVELEPDGQRFRSCELVPEGVLFPERQYNLVVEPLYFQENQLGFVLLEVGPREGAVYEALQTQISSALQGALLMGQAEKRSRQLQTVAEVSTEASVSLLDTSVLLQKVVDLTKERFGLYHVHLYLLNQAEDALVLTAGAGKVGRRMVADGWQIAMETKQSMVAQIAQSRQGRVVNNVRDNPYWLPDPLLPDTCSELAVPLIAGERLMGVLDVQSDEVNHFTEDDIQIQNTLAAQIAVTLENAKLFERLDQANIEIKVLNEKLREENVRMMAELNVTQQLQKMLLPKPEELQQVEGLDIAGYMKSADEVGGDYYDILEHNGRIKIGIGDVTGHGLESGVVMLMLQTIIRTLLTSDITDPIQFMDILNRTIHKNIERMNVDRSLSLALVDYIASPADQVSEMRLSGQHEQLIVVRKDGQIELEDTIDLGFPVGLIADIGEFVNELSINLESGDGIVLYSDGITEAENEAKEFYGLERLCQIISQHWSQSSDAIKQSVVDDVQTYIGEQTVYDDITLVVIKRK